MFYTWLFIKMTLLIFLTIKMATTSYHLQIMFVKCQFNQSTLIFVDWLQKIGFIHFYNQNIFLKLGTEIFPLKKKLGVLIVVILMYIYDIIFMIYLFHILVFHKILPQYHREKKAPF
jgi:hypothetical protein